MMPHFQKGDQISASFLNDIIQQVNAAMRVTASEPLRSTASMAGIQLACDPVYPLERLSALTTNQTALTLGDCPANRTSIVRLANSTGGLLSVAGIERSHQGRGAFFWNAGPDEVAMLHDSGSAADDENKILIQGEADITLGMGDCALAWYLETDLRWRMTAMGATAGGGGTVGLTFSDIYNSSVLAIDHKAEYYTESFGSSITLTLASSTITMTPSGTIDPTYLDGGVPVVGTRILYNEAREASGHSLNGILVFTGLGSASTGVTLVRATDYDSAAKISASSKVTVTGGDEFHDKTFILKNDGTVTVNTTDLIFDLHAEKQDIGWSSLVLASGDEEAVVLPHICRQVRVSTSEEDFQIQGVEPVKERVRRILWNVGSETIIVKHQNDNAYPEFRIICATGKDLILYPNGLCFLDYDDITERWRAAVISDRAAATFPVTADQAPLDLELNRLLQLVPDANFRLIQGIRQNPNPLDGLPARIRDLGYLVNRGTFTLALMHADGAVSAHERINCPGNTSMELRPSEAVEVIRDNSGDGWNVLSMSRTESGSSTTTPLTLIHDLASGNQTFSGVTTLHLTNTGASSSSSTKAFTLSATVPTGTLTLLPAAASQPGYVNAPGSWFVSGSNFQQMGLGCKGFDCIQINGGSASTTHPATMPSFFAGAGSTGGVTDLVLNSAVITPKVRLSSVPTDQTNYGYSVWSIEGSPSDTRTVDTPSYLSFRLDFDYSGGGGSNVNGVGAHLYLDSWYSEATYPFGPGHVTSYNQFAFFVDGFIKVRDGYRVVDSGGTVSPGLTGTLFPIRAQSKGGIVTSLGLAPAGSGYVPVSTGTTAAGWTYALIPSINGSSSPWTLSAQSPLSNVGSGTTFDISLGTVDVPHGGTGLTSVTAGVLMLGNGTSAFTELPGSAAGQAAIWNGSAWAAGSTPYTDGAYNFGGGSTGDVASITITNGIITGMTFVP